ncbi:MAG: sigma-70 family RNA polymerase sigma factor [Zunongwangia sp.]|uniref:RNA polymerase sigma factor n=1 Tax=Zunongwangia sp. TaxID=1965325 RepID=UPI003241C678
MSKELIRKAQKGDKHALNALINKHKDLAFSIAFKYLKNIQDSEDTVQDCFVIVLNSIKSFRNESKFSTWLYTIIYRECLKHIKRSNQSVDYVPQYVSLEQEDENNDVNRTIGKLMEVLSKSEFLVVTLFYLEEKKIKDISKITNFSKANIKVILHRARLKMKEKFNEK